MPSLTWIDHDAEAHERSLRILALFQEREIRDGLGLGDKCQGQNMVRSSAAEYLPFVAAGGSSDTSVEAKKGTANGRQ